MWKVGDKLRHRFNDGAGPGRVAAVSGRRITVQFPATGAMLEFAATSDALAPFEMTPGTIARFEPEGETVTIAGREGSLYRLADGRLVADADLWPVDGDTGPAERLARGEVGRIEGFANRLDALYLKSLREAGGLGSYLGGRIRIFPHQFYVAERASHADPVRWLLADEVGLGKTIEACLILNRLAREGRAERILIVTPATLTVQWLGELYRKFHQVFVLLDEKRRQDVARELGDAFNPFEAHARVIISLEELVRGPNLTRLACAAGFDLAIVDESHRLERPRGHPGGTAYRAVAPIVLAARHALLLTATPLESDAHGFFRLLQLLRPGEFPEETDFEERLVHGEPLPPCTSATRRADIGGLPPRLPLPVGGPGSRLSGSGEGGLVMEEGGAAPGAAGWAQGWESLLELEERVKRIEAKTGPERRRKLDRYRRALASPAALAPLLGPDETIARAEAQQAAERDPRAAWLAAQAPAWRKAGEKTLVFVADRETLESVRERIERSTGQRVGIFHEELSEGRADIEVAQFRLAAGPAVLVTTECGGEGRNFEFCRRIVLYDLPWNPGVLEQRIGRLDRLGRDRPVEIVYFRPPRGLGLEVARLYEELGILREPLAGLEGTFSGIEGAIEAAAAGETDGDGIRDAFSKVLAEARAVRSKIREAAWHELHRDPYRPELAPGILERIPPDLEETTAEVVLAACEEFGFHVVQQRGRAAWAIEFGSASRIDHLPGVPAGSSFLGTFDREEAVEKENIDFFASGHPLVEGVLQEIEESPRGRVALLQVRAKGVRGAGVLALFVEGGRPAPIILDEEGRERPEWEELLLSRPLRCQRVKAEEWTSDPEWADRVRVLFARIRHAGRPVAVAAFRILPA